MDIDVLRWKYRQHKNFIEAGMKHSIITDLISKKQRKQNYQTWYELPRQVAYANGCEFSKETPSTSLNEVFVERIYDIPDFIPMKGETVYDVGASYGDSAIWWSKMHGANVISFEPLKDIFNILKDNIAINKAPVTAYNLAVGNGNESGISRVGNMLGKSEKNKTNTIQTVRLDDLQVENMELLKIDVEGFELDVLHGAADTIKQFKPKIILETHSSVLKTECNQFLTDIGYELKVSGRKVRNRVGWMDSIQNLFYIY